jgi:hypothetical protein
LADFTITNHAVFPTDNDTNGGSNGAGNKAPESTLKVVFDRGNRVEGGFIIPSSGSRTCQISSGTALINGYEVFSPSNLPIDVTFDDNTAMLWVWLKLTKDIGGKVNGCKIRTVTTDAVEADGVLLGRVTTSGGNITAMVDVRSIAREVWGTFEYRTSGAKYRVLVGSSDWDIVDGAGSNVRVTFSVPFGRNPDNMLMWKSAIGVAPSFLVLNAVTTTYVEWTLSSPANLERFSFRILV